MHSDTKHRPNIATLPVVFEEVFELLAATKAQLKWVQESKATFYRLDNRTLERILVDNQQQSDYLLVVNERCRYWHTLSLSESQKSMLATLEHNVRHLENYTQQILFLIRHFLQYTLESVLLQGGSQLIEDALRKPLPMLKDSEPGQIESLIDQLNQTQRKMIVEIDQEMRELQELNENSPDGLLKLLLTHLNEVNGLLNQVPDHGLLACFSLCPGFYRYVNLLGELVQKANREDGKTQSFPI